MKKISSYCLGWWMRPLAVLLFSSAAILSMAACSESPSPVEQERTRLPNIIFIMADDLGYGDIGCYGQQLIQTPSIDRMATEGTRFTSVYAGATFCAPSRSVLITGQHLGHTRVRDNSGFVGGLPDEVDHVGHRIPLEDEDVTVAEVLKQAGYVTGMTGKWGLGEANSTGEPNRQGFDEWLGYLNQNHAVFYFTDYLWHNGQKRMLPENQNGARKTYTHDVFTDFALDFIRNHRNKPFFLYVPYTIPHLDFEVPDTAPYTQKPWPEKSKIFAAMITRMDRDVGRILDLLKDLDLDSNTLVFFTSDQGSPNLGGNQFRSNGPFEGKKGKLDEGGLRVPMIAHWPGKVPAGRVSDQVWYFADVLPTLAELSGTRVPSNVDGISVLPALTGKAELPDRFLYWENPGPPMEQAMRWRQWKARREDMKGPLRLYDVESDPHEKQNIAGQHPEVISQFEEYLKTARTESRYWPTGQN